MAQRVIVALLLMLIAAGSGATELLADGQAIVKQLILADFEQPAGHPLALGWQRLPADGEFGFHYGQAANDRPGSGGQVLRAGYRLPDRTATAQADQEVGLSLNLLGLDASEYDHLAFWLKGDATEGFSPQIEIGFDRPPLTAPGVPQQGRSPVDNISGEWRQVVIPLRQMMGISDWHSMSAFRFMLPGSAAVRHGAYLIDDIALIKLEASRPAESGPPPGKQSLEHQLGGEIAAKPYLQQRLNGWPNQALVDPKTLPGDDREFLRRLAADTWRGLDAFTDREHGLPLDRIQFGSADVRLASARIGDYTNITNIGFHLLAIAAAYELKLIDEAQALQRLNTTIATLEHLESAHGFFFNYYNTTTLEPTSRFLSFVDSSWLTAGFIVIRQTFPSLAERLTRLIERGNYRFFYDAATKLMSHGHFVDTEKRSTYHYGTLYTEARIGSLIAIGKRDVEAEHWFAMTRTLPAEYTWQTGAPQSRREKNERGFRWNGGYYEWKDLRYVPSWGGSLFEALMPVLVLDEARFAPNSLGRNGAIHTAIQRRYALEDLGYPVWGMSPSSAPGSGTYGEYGVRFLGSLGYREGIVTPHAAALALLTEPEAATRNLRVLAERYPIYGDFGFYDAVDPKSSQVAYIYLCLNQAMILVALADHLTERSIQRHFSADPIIQPVHELIGFENFFD